MLGKEVNGLLGSWWVVERRSDWMTRPTRHRVLYQSKTSSIVTGWSCHHGAISRCHRAIWWWVMRSNRYWIGPSLSPGVCQVSIMFFSSHDSFYYALSSFLSPYVICPYVYSSSDPWFSHDPLSLCSRWFTHSHDPLHFRTNEPIIVSLLFILLKQSKLWSRFTSQAPDKLLWPFHTLFDAFVSLLLCYL